MILNLQQKITGNYWKIEEIDFVTPQEVTRKGGTADDGVITIENVENRLGWTISEVIYNAFLEGDGYNAEDGYTDDYYDDYVDHDITLGYFANAKAMNKWIDEHEDDYGNVMVVDEKVCYDEELQFEEIEVIE